jgi:hypothetical protein
MLPAIAKVKITPQMENVFVYKNTVMTYIVEWLTDLSSCQHPTLLTPQNGCLYENLAITLLVKKCPALSEALSE